MSSIEIFQQRREIEVLKMCKHPNIVSLIDLFENQETYFMVIEYMQGGDLFDFAQMRKFRIPEPEVKRIAYRIGLSIQYLHSFGIVHRDLKLENVMMSDKSDKAVPKLVDFGLAKLIGPNEKADEPFGTLGYIAPEVLNKEPYSFSCDVWSYGCIIYALMCGYLPFDNEDPKIVMKMTNECDLIFDEDPWNNFSSKVKSLLKQLLEKDPAKRLSLDQALKHRWFDSLQEE